MVATPHIVAGFFIATTTERLRLRNGYLRKRGCAVASACLASFFSHFLLDAIPHYDYTFHAINDPDNAYKIFIDFLFAFAIFIFVFGKLANVIIKSWDGSDGPAGSASQEAHHYLWFLGFASLVVFCGLLPDILIVALRARPTNVYLGFKKIHDFFHSSVRPGMFWGFLSQIALCAGSALWLKKESVKLRADIIGKEILGKEAETWLSVNRQ